MCCGGAFTLCLFHTVVISCDDNVRNDRSIDRGCDGVGVVIGAVIDYCIICTYGIF